MALRRTLARLKVEGERDFTMRSAPMDNTGGIPFFGNIYSGRVDSASYVPGPQGGSTKALLHGKQTLWEDPVVRAKVQKCPYFALCDQVIFHNMDPVYLDPGLLSSEEHQLLLLFSRAYYEKWKEIHTRPPNSVAQLRIKYGKTTLLDQIFQKLAVDPETREVLKLEYMLDDSSLIGMNPRCWSTAFLDPFNMDQLSGRVLEFAGVTQRQQESWFLLLDQMRRFPLIRRDGPRQTETVLPFSKATTLFELYKLLDLPPYSGQLKVYNFKDMQGTNTTVTLKDEAAYFDLLVTLFYHADLDQANLSQTHDDDDHTSRYSVIVEPYTVADRRVGRWF